MLVKLKELITIKNGSDYKHLSKGNIPVIGTGGVMLYVDQYLYNKEAILLPRKGSLNNIMYINEPFWTVDTMFYSIPNHEKINAKYLYYHLSLLDFTRYDVGSTIPSMTSSLYYSLSIDIPSLENQNKIASILSSIDDQIERNNKMVKKLQVLGKTIFEKFSAKVNNYVNITNISEVIWGQCPEGENILNEESYSTIKYASGAGDIDDEKVSINPKAYTNNSRRFVEKNTVCISVAGTVGKTAIAREKISIGRAMLGFYNKQKFGLIYFSLLKYAPIIQKQATGAIQKIINNNHLEIISKGSHTSSWIESKVHTIFSFKREFSI